MLACIIEFGTVPGKEDRRRELVAEMLIEAATIEGFISKETFKSLDTDRVITLSYWDDAEALKRWMRNAQHRIAIPEGKNELFSHYTIQLADVTSEKTWTKPVVTP
jgi:heme-degrading monooxygenase HmoA